MKEILVYSAAIGGAAPHTEHHLKRLGIPLVHHPTPDVTHLLLDVPSRDIPDGLLERLPETVCIVGGNLDQTVPQGYRALDLLKHEAYLAQNAAITADCAMRVAAARMQSAFSGTSVLVIGWGRIGKCLARLLKNNGCYVTVAARSCADRAMLNALGYDALPTDSIHGLHRFNLIFNTAPAPILDREALSRCPNTLKIDLASSQGLEGADVIWARGLPGLYAPESAGRLIAETFVKEVTP